MMTFNAAEREVCLVRKGHTNSPLQALTLMNNVAFVEASRLMAERILREGGKSLETQISYGVRVCISRHPRLKELNVLRDVYGDFLAEFNANEAAAEKLLSVGEFPRARDLDSIQLAAMTMVASTIMNLDEAVTKE